MSKILKRNQFLSIHNQNYDLLSEALANEVNWGDSLLGRLINSMIRKFEIMLDFRDIDKCIKRLQAEFDRLTDYIKVKKTESLEVKLFYVQISIILGVLQKKAEESNEPDVMIKQTDDSIREIRSISPPNQECAKDKEEVLQKLEEFKKKLEELPTTENKNKEEGNPKLALNPSPNPNGNGGGQLALTQGDVPKALNVSKLTPEQAKEYLPKYVIAIKNSESTLAKYKAELKEIKVLESTPKLDPSHIDDLKAKYREATLLAHPDKNQTEDSLLYKDADGTFEKIKSAYQKKDLKTLTEILDKLKKMKATKENEANLKKIKSELSKKVEALGDGGKKDIKALPSGENKEVKQLGGKKEENEEKPKEEEKPAEVEESKKSIFSYLQFIKENEEIKQSTDEYKEGEDAETDNVENIDEDSKSIRLIFLSIFTKEFMKKYEFSDKDAQDFEEDEATSIDIDPIIEIVKIFNRAYKITTPGTIPSGRKEGIVSQSLFKGYEYVGDGPNPATLGEGGNVKPGLGPYRNRALFNKWENAVLDIIKDPKYQEIFNEKTYFKFKKADPRINVSDDKKEGGGRALLKFMNEMLDGGKLYKEGAQKKFIEEYFGVTIDSKKLSITKKERKDNALTASKQKVEQTYKFETYNPSAASALKVDGTLKVIFRGLTKEKTRYYFRVIFVENNTIYFTMTGACPFDLNIDDVKTPLKKDGKIYVGSADWTDFQNKKIINTKRLISSKEDIKTWKEGDEFTAKIESLQILKNSEGETFKGDVKGKEVEHQEKLININKFLKEAILKLKAKS